MTAALRELFSVAGSSAEIRQRCQERTRYVPHPPVTAEERGVSRRAFVLAGAFALTAMSPLRLRAQDASEPPPKPRNPRVLFITSPDAPQCAKELTRLRAPGGDFAKLQAVGWKIGAGPENHLQIVDQAMIPQLIAQLNVRDYPTVACIYEGEVIRSFQSGCTTPLDMWTFGWLAKGIDERPPSSVPEAVRAETTGHYPLRGNHWSVDGDWSPSREAIVSHMRGPAHARYLNASWEIETWSYEELRSLHDNLHDTYGGGVSASRAKTSSSANQFSAGRKIKGM